MAAKKYIVKGINRPGLINVQIGGRFRDVELHNAPQEVLEELYNDKCPFVDLSPAEHARQTGRDNIQVKKVETKKTNRKTNQ